MDILIFWLLAGFITGYITTKKGYGMGLALVLALFSLIGLVIAICLPKRNRPNLTGGRCSLCSQPGCDGTRHLPS